MRSSILILIIAFLSLPARSSEPKPEEQDILVHLAIFPSYEINPNLSFALVVPQNLGGEPQDSVSFNLNSGNSFNPNVNVESTKVDGCTFNYNVDTVADRLDIRMTKKLNEHFEAEATVGAYSTSGQSRVHPLGYLVSDNFIEEFHLKVQGRDDPFGRKALGYDRAVVQIRDCNGSELDLKPGDIYYLPLRIGTTYYHDLMSNARNRTSFNIGAHVAFPLSEASRSVSGAISMNLINTLKVTEKIDWTIAAGTAVVDQNLYTVHRNTPLVMEYDPYTDFYITSGFSYERNSGAIYRMGASLHNKSRFLRTDNYDWEGSQVDQHSRRAIAGPNDYVEVFFSRESKKWVVQLGIREDFRAASKLTEDNHVYYQGGSNSEDLGVNLSVSRKVK